MLGGQGLSMACAQGKRPESSHGCLTSLLWCRFPHWSLSIKLMPAAPPAPGVATFKAAAMAEGKDPDQAVNEARQKVQSCPSIVYRVLEPQ